MAEVVNEIGSLSTLKKELRKNHIDMFNSIKDISEFERTFEHQLQEIKAGVRADLLSRIETIESSIEELTETIEHETKAAESEIAEQIRTIQDRRFALRIHQNRFTLRDWNLYILNGSLRRRSRRLSRQINQYARSKTTEDRSALKLLTEQHNDLKENFDDHFRRIEVAKCRHVRTAKDTIDTLRPTILGTIGENKVASTLSELPDNYTVINDVKVKLDRPIYNKRENDRIYSFQIDHVVVGPSGIFVIETKHWSKDSIANRDLFSPVKQIRRSGYALYTIINSAIKSRTINIGDSWGNRSVSVRNIIAFSASSTNKKFEHVKLLEASSINGYIEWFEQELSESDTRKIRDFVVRSSR